MLERSRKSAIVMTAIATIPPGAILYAGEAAQASARGLTDKLDPLTGGIVLVLAMAVLIVLASRAFYAAFKASCYYGREGALRWALFALLLAIQWLMTLLILPDPDRASSMGPYVISSLLETGLRIIALVVSFWVAFQLIKRNQPG